MFSVLRAVATLDFAVSPRPIRSATSAVAAVTAPAMRKLRHPSFAVAPQARRATAGAIHHRLASDRRHPIW